MAHTRLPPYLGEPASTCGPPPRGQASRPVGRELQWCMHPGSRVGETGSRVEHWAAAFGVI